MPARVFTTDETTANQRLDKLLAARFGLGRAAVKRLFDEGRVRVGRSRRPGSKGDLLQAGFEVEVDVPDATIDAVATPEPNPATPLAIELERDDVVVVDKPAGQPTAPLRGGEVGTLANALVGRFPEMATVGFHAREPGLVHRLDTGTSGLVLAARSKRAFDALVAGLRAGRLVKEYIAACEDNELPERGSIDVPLAPHPKDTRRVLACLHPRDAERLSPRPARTDYVVERRGGGFAIVKIKAPRALRHQIRAHFAAIDCPLAGDTLYGAKRTELVGRHALHASRIGWPGDPNVPAFDVRSPLPGDLAALLEN